MNNIGLEIAAALIAVHSNEGPKTVDAHIALYLEALSKLSAYPAPSVRRAGGERDKKSGEAGAYKLRNRGGEPWQYIRAHGSPGQGNPEIALANSEPSTGASQDRENKAKSGLQIVTEKNLGRRAGSGLFESGVNVPDGRRKTWQENI
jgi:hypothetical protein